MSGTLPARLTAEREMLRDESDFYVASCSGNATMIEDDEALAAAIAHRYSVHAALVAALREIETICTESAGDCRKRMGTRAGNASVVARAALAACEGKA